VMAESKTRDPRWIEHAIKHPGSLRRSAKRAGQLTSKGTIKTDWLDKQAEKGGVIGQRARLAKTLKKLGGK